MSNVTNDMLTVLFMIPIMIVAGCATNATNGDAAAPPETKADVFRREYASAKTADERRSLVLQAIDTEVIYRNISIKELKMLFGNAIFVRFEANKDRYGLAKVYFVPPVPPPDPLMHPGLQGWYLDISFNMSGYVEYYSLSNLYK